MNASNLKLVSYNSKSENEFGETALNFAPRIRLSNGELAVPQQFLEVSRTLENLSNVLAEIQLPKHYQLFCGQEASVLYLQIGVIGQENYAASVKVPGQDKVVYGRRWIIEDSTPSSEIVQTAMLAVKKAREHELRELVTLRINDGKSIATPFNCHLDLPLMQGNRSAMNSDTPFSINSALPKIRIAKASLKLIQSITFGSKRIIEVCINTDKNTNVSDFHFPELLNTTITVVCEQADGSDFLHQLISTLITLSDRTIEEQIAFKGFNRFSHKIDVLKLAEFSYQTRNISATDSRFDSAFENMSYRIDASKAPGYNHGKLGRQQRNLMSKFKNLGGHLPG